MLTTYRQEVKRKRRAARVFWMIVFTFATVLYFFFLGYYPDIGGGLSRILGTSSGTTASGESHLIRSFGIININVSPTGSNISLGSGGYIADEKRIVDYGPYTINISKTGYIPHKMTFLIDQEKPFFIEEISLIPIPQVKKMSIDGALYPLDGGGYLYQTGSGLSLRETPADSRSRLIYSGSLSHVTGTFFRSGATILSWSEGTLRRADGDVENFINTCADIRYQSTLLYCPTSQSLLTKNNTYLTGILDIHNHLIYRSGSVLTLRDGNIKNTLLTLSGPIDPYHTAYLDGELYRLSSGSLRAVSKKIEPIPLALDDLQYAAIVHSDLIYIGTHVGKPQLIIQNKRDPINRTRSIALPQSTDYRYTEIYDLSGNLILHTPSQVIIIYRGGSTLSWSMSSEIIDVSSTGALYKKDGTIWNADWSPIELSE